MTRWWAPNYDKFMFCTIIGSLLFTRLIPLLIVVNLYLCCRKACRLLLTSCAGSSSRPSRKVAVEEVDSLLDDDEKMVPMSHGLD